MTDDQWPTSNRERMLEALAEVLRGIEGVQFVDRQDIDPTSMVSEAKLPAIVIDEERTRYEWAERHGQREMAFASSIILDLQAYTRKSDDRAGYQISTVRELFVARVLNELANESTLTTQLADENEPQAHADDVAIDFDVRYPKVKPPKCRALVTISSAGQEYFDDRQVSDWQKIVAEIYSYDDSDDPPDTEFSI